MYLVKLYIMSLLSKRTKGKVLHSDARTMVFKLCSFLKGLSSEEVCAKTIFLQTQALTVKACDVCVYSVARILQHRKSSSLDSGTPLLWSPGNDHKSEKRVTNLDEFEKDVPRHTIYEMYDIREYPTLKSHVRLMRDKIKSRGLITSMRFILKNLGFRYK